MRTVQEPSYLKLKAAVSVTAMAKMIGMSKSSFYDYIKRGVFPYPVYSLANQRPLYTADAQQEILAVRQTGIGCDGTYVLFYEKRTSLSTPASTGRRQMNQALVEGLKSLGLTNVSGSQIDAAIAVTFPKGTTNVDEAVVLRMVYRHLRSAGLG